MAAPLHRKRVLVVEDEPDLREVLAYNLDREGHDVETVAGGREALAAVSRRCPDLILLDLMLPGLNGLEVCRRLRESPDTSDLPIIMLTARTAEMDVVAGLGLGADDYVTKPFRMAELLARVRARFRQVQRPAATQSLDHGGVSVDLDRHEVLVNGRPVTCTPTEIRLLHRLISRPGRVFRRGELLGDVTDGAIVIERNIDVHIGSLRKKLGPLRHLIQTVRGIGYRAKDLESQLSS